jgi:Flp pilus assembly protein TadG
MAGFRNRVARLARAECGTVAPMLGILAIPLCLFIGLAVDHSRALTLKARTLEALDAAALAAARAMQAWGASDEEVIAIANRYFEERMARFSTWAVAIDPLAVTIDRENDTVTLAAAGKVDTYFARLANVDQLSVATTSAAVFGIKEIEVGLMLDVSGSMGDFGKIDDLKDAAKEFVEILLPGTPDAPKARVGLAPYSSAVNPGDYAVKVKGSSGKTNCVSERKGANAFTDASPSTGHKLGSKPWSCPDAEVLALTDDKGKLVERIDSYEPDGSTAGHLGIGWAWYLVSPSWNDVWPAESAPGPYGDKKVLKAVVLMTDGMFNREYELADNGSSAVQAAALCENIKSENVLVFSVALQAPPEVLPVLQGCASSATYFFDVTTGAQLSDAYAVIARKLTELRLSK